MATIASRLTSAGVLSIAGEFDEVTKSTINLTITNQYAALLDEITLQPVLPPLNLTTNVNQVFVGLYGNGGTGVAGVPVELGFYYGGTAFPDAIVGDLVPVGSRVYVRWSAIAYVGSTAGALVDMGIVSSVVKSGNNSYVMVSNPNGVSRPFNSPDPVTGFINTNIVAYSASQVYIEYPAEAAKKETNTGTLMVSGYFDEVTKFPGTLMASSTYDSEGWVSTSTDYSGVTGDFVFYYPNNPTGQTNSGGARTVPLPYDGSSKYYAEILITAIDTSTHDGNPYNDGFSAVMIGVCGDSSSGGTSNVPCIYLADGTGRGTYAPNNIPPRPDPQPSYNNNLPDHFVPGDTFMIAYDSATNKVYFGRNGQWSINPTSGAGITIPGSPGSNSTRIIIMSAATFHVTLSGRFRRAADLAYPLPSGFISAAT